MGSGFPADLQHAMASFLLFSPWFSGLLRGKEKGREREREIREKQLSKLMVMLILIKM